MTKKSTGQIIQDNSTSNTIDSSYYPPFSPIAALESTPTTAKATTQVSGYFIVSTEPSQTPRRYAGSVSSSAETYRSLNGQLKRQKQ